MENPNDRSNVQYPNGENAVQMAPIPQKLKAKMLFVISIIMLIFAAISLISTTVSVAGMNGIIETYKSMGMPLEMLTDVRKFLQASVIFSLIFSIIKIGFGAVGILSVKKPERSNLIIISGFIMVGLVFINLFVITKPLMDIMKPFLEGLGVGAGADLGNVIGVIMSLILPILYIISGIMLGRLKEDDSTV